MKTTDNKQALRHATARKSGLALALLLPACAAWGASPADPGPQAVSNEAHTLTLTADPDVTAIRRGKPATKK